MNIIIGLIGLFVMSETIITGIKDRITNVDYYRAFIFLVLLAYMAEKYIRFMIEGVYQ